MSLDLLSMAIELVHLTPLLSQKLLGGKNEKIAHSIVTTAQKIVGHHDQSIVSTLSKNPEMMLEFQGEMLALYTQLENAAAEKKRKARAKDLAFLQAGRKNLRLDIMVCCAALGLFFSLVCLVFFKGALPGEAVGIISTVAGIFGSCLKDAYAFEFGSSRGSKDKDERVAAILKSLEQKNLNPLDAKEL